MFSTKCQITRILVSYALAYRGVLLILNQILYFRREWRWDGNSVTSYMVLLWFATGLGYQYHFTVDHTIKIIPMAAEQTIRAWEIIYKKSSQIIISIQSKYDKTNFAYIRYDILYYTLEVKLDMGHCY